VLLGLSVEIPYLIVWVIALFGYLGLKNYTQTLKGSRDGEGFSLIASGIFILALWLPLSALISNLTNQIYLLHPHLTSAMVITNNYLNMIILIPALIVIDRGAKKLLSLVKKPVYTLSQSWTLAYICFAVVYTYLTLHDPARLLPTSTVPVASYYEPDWLVTLTFIVPRLLTWFLGVQAVQNIYRYRKQIKGVLYSRALKDLSFGLGSVVIFTILLRCAQSMSTLLERLSLGFVLLVLYVLVILIGVSNVFVLRGARKLQQIEEL